MGTQYFSGYPKFYEKSPCPPKRETCRGYDLAVALKVQNRIIGSCGIHISNPENREGWIGYVFNRKFWGKGYAKEAEYSSAIRLSSYMLIPLVMDLHLENLYGNLPTIL